MQIAWQVPRDFKRIIRSWDKVHKSPYSKSYYNCDDGEKDWGRTPVGCIRISDHWNFKRFGKLSCPTDLPVNNYREWAMAEWDGKRYHIIERQLTCSLWEIADDEVDGTDLTDLLKSYRIKIIKQRTMRKIR